MEGFPSGQREQTVNLSSMTSVVRIHHLPPKEPILIRVSVLFWCQVEWIRKPALKNLPVARFNHRGLPVGRQPLKYLMVVPAAKRIHHRTGRHACSSAIMGLHQPITAGTRPIRREEQVVRWRNQPAQAIWNDILPFATLSRRGAQCAPRQRKIIRFVG